MLNLRTIFPQKTDNFWEVLQKEFREKNFTIDEVEQSINIVKDCFIYNEPTLAHFLNYKKIYKEEYNNILYKKEEKKVKEYLKNIDNKQKIKIAQTYLNIVNLIKKYGALEKLFLSFNDFKSVNNIYISNNKDILRTFRKAISGYEYKINKSLEIILIAWINNNSKSL